MPTQLLCIGPVALELAVHRQHFPKSPTATPQAEVKLSSGVCLEAVQAAKRHKQVHLVSRVGRDELGDMVLATLRAASVNTTFVKRPFNCPSSYRQQLATEHGTWRERVEQNDATAITVDDVMAAQALFLSSELLILDTQLAPAVMECALNLAAKYDVEVRYADASKPAVVLGVLAERQPSENLPTY